MEDQRLLAADVPGVDADIDAIAFDGQPQPGPAKAGDDAGDGDTSAEFPPILIFQAALGLFDLLLSVGYLGLWYLDPESLSRTVAGVSGVPLFLGFLAVLTGGWIRYQDRRTGRAAPGAAWTILGIASGLALAVLSAGFPIWVTFNEMF